MSGPSRSTPVTATVVTNSSSGQRVDKQFAIDVNKDDAKSGDSHLNSLMNCVNRLETSLNQYLTKIIDDENDPNPEAVSAAIAGEAIQSAVARGDTYGYQMPNNDMRQQQQQQQQQCANRSANSDYYQYDTGYRPTDGPKHKRSKNK